MVDDHDAAAAILGADELQRAQRFRFDKDRRFYVAAHVGLRQLLAFYLDVSPRAIEFAMGRHGKPMLAGADAGELEFNLSHSHEIALVAIARRVPVGIDVEAVKKDFPFQEVAERFFTRREVSSLRALPPALQRRAFFQCWTSKEAFLKAKATGLAGQLDEVEILVTDGVVTIGANVPGWCLVPLATIVGYEAAMVAHGAAPIVRCYRW
jgi:4'-phosphopantetheinyl transferase